MIKILYKLIFYFLTILGTSMLIIGFAQIVSRYFLHYSLPWSEEALRFLNTWTIFIGVSVGIPMGVHVAIDAVPNLLKGKVRKILTFVILTLSLVFYWIFMVQGMKFALANLNQRSPAIMMPMGYVYLCMPLGGLLAILFTVAEVAKLWERPGENK